MKEYYDSDGVRCIFLNITFSSGSTAKDVDIDVSNDGWYVVATEAWDQMMLNPKEFYSQFPNLGGVSDEDFLRRRFAMEDAVRDMKRRKGVKGDAIMASTFNCKLPFHVDRSATTVTYVGYLGTFSAHIVLKEKGKLKPPTVVMLDAPDSNPEEKPDKASPSESSPQLGQMATI